MTYEEYIFYPLNEISGLSATKPELEIQEEEEMEL